MQTGLTNHLHLDSTMDNLENKAVLKSTIEDLTGQKIPLNREIPNLALDLLLEKETKGLGYSQFNELLLSLGYDRVSHSFFQFLIKQTINYNAGASFTSIDQLRRGVDEFRKIAILFFGNIKFGFKTLSRDASFLKDHIRRFSQRREENFFTRHEQIMSPSAIAGEDSYLLGYVVKHELADKLAKKPGDADLLAQEERRKQIVAKGKKNHEGYLVSDHLDVYIATSMRERHEFISVYETTRAIFSHDALANLKLRWFDPTQAFCEDRIDKGLAEGLMLRRAKCTIYFAQESDTFGKDSELASTLAQGKPVIAYVPRPKKNAAEELLQQLSKGEEDTASVVLKQLQVYDPTAAWVDPSIRTWIEKPATIARAAGAQRLQSAIESHFERRDKLLREVHPLGIQINLQTGVANGVLVANSIDQCAHLVRALLLRQLEFELSHEAKNGNEYLYLRERITGSIFRVVTGDAFLTNAFWNFYLSPTEETYDAGNDDADYAKAKNDPYDVTRSGTWQPSLFDFNRSGES